MVGADRIPGDRGIDRLMFRYFAAKLPAERVIEASGLPWTTLRAAQFHTLVATVTGTIAKLPIALIPAGVRFQPVAAREVAERLVELALDGPHGLADEMGGPRALTTREPFESYIAATGRRRRPILSMPLPGRGVRAIREGANLCPGEFLATERQPVPAASEAEAAGSVNGAP